MVRLLSTSYPVEFNPVYQFEEIDSFINLVNNLFQVFAACKFNNYVSNIWKIYIEVLVYSLVRRNAWKKIYREMQAYRCFCYCITQFSEALQSSLSLGGWVFINVSENPVVYI